MILTVKNLKELWTKEFLPNIRKEIGKEIDSLVSSTTTKGNLVPRVSLLPFLGAGLSPAPRKGRRETLGTRLNKRFDETEKSQNFISKKYDTVISTIKNLKHNEGVKSQIQGNEEDTNKLGNDGYSVEVKLGEL